MPTLGGSAWVPARVTVLGAGRSARSKRKPGQRETGSGRPAASRKRAAGTRQQAARKRAAQTSGERRWIRPAAKLPQRIQKCQGCAEQWCA